jgi:putative sterol carrier protein
MAKFPSSEWLQALNDQLNADERYAQIARNWEGDMMIIIEPGGAVAEVVRWYIDLWHGKCRGVAVLEEDEDKKATFTLRGAYDNFVRLLNGEVEPMQALLTRKIGVQGNMAVLMKNVPTVLDFVRCCRAVTDSFL